MKKYVQTFAIPVLLAALLTVHASALTFGDVGGDAWYASAVSDVSDIGIMVGDDLGNFNPDKPVTRAEMAIIVLPGAFFPAEKSIGPKAVLGQVALRLGILGKGPALAPLTVTAQDDGGANALDEPLVFAVLADGVKIDRLTFVVNHVHGSSLLGGK